MFTIRLPMLFSGILSLPLMYVVGKRILNDKLGMTAMFLLAISPWHIILSRWAVESNILPFIFLVGFAFILKSLENESWFIAACGIFALCLYAYGTAYLAIPIFLACAIAILIYFNKSGLRNICFGLALFTLITAPILLFIVVNTFHLSSINLGPFTIPRLPTQARYELLSAVFNANPLMTLGNNALGMLNLLWTQTDGLLWNGLDPYGYLYTITFPLAVIGIFLLFPKKKNPFKPENILLLSWLLASICIGIIQPSNINRINLIFIPLFLCIALLLVKLGNWYKPVFNFAIFFFLIGFVSFTRAYHSEDFQKHANGVFNNGLIPALEAAKRIDNVPICVTDTVYLPYIYVLFTEKKNPADYSHSIEWINASDPFRDTHSLGRYKFGLNSCPNDPNAIYILSMKELPPPPENETKYKIIIFSKYRVFFLNSPVRSEKKP